MGEFPYTDEQVEELKAWLIKPHEPGDISIPDSAITKIRRLIAKVDSLNRYIHLVEEETSRLKRAIKL